MFIDFTSLGDLLPYEIRLSPAAACRAWSEAHGCWSAEAWDRELGNLPSIRHFFEALRLRVSEVLGVEGIDRLGLMRKLLIHESTASSSRQWLRELGFVHLEAASGIHLYCFWRSYEGLLESLSHRFRMPIAATRFFRTVVPLVVWFFFWGMVGFRPGLLRPVILVCLRFFAARSGIQWRKGVPLFTAIGVDAGFGFLHAYGSDFAFMNWAPGEMHYLLSWWGGILGYEWAKERSYGSFRAHFFLSLFSWITVLPLELSAGRFSPLTPFLSFFTVEFFTRGGFLIFIFAAFFTGLSGDASDLSGQVLSWSSVLWNAGIGEISRVLSISGGIRKVGEIFGLFSAVLLSLVLLGFQLGKFRHSDGKSGEKLSNLQV